MPITDQYRDQVALLMRVLPIVAQEDCFALKGGTAINLFVRNFPRLSVDIDLAYLPVQPRDQSLKEVEDALKRIAKNLREKIPECRVHEQAAEGRVIKLTVRTLQGTQVVIEVNPVIRGSVEAAEKKAVAEAVQDEFGFAEIQVLSHSDLYAGKLAAALDRQHPRDFFDVRDLLANEGLDETLRKAFLVYLVSHRRPMWEILSVPRKDLRPEYERGFIGMTDEDIPLATLEATREELVQKLIAEMPESHKRFLVSWERGDPDWDSIGLPDAATLPAVLWRKQQLDGLSKEKRDALVANLEKVLGLK